jgi:hypothetical protein
MSRFDLPGTVFRLCLPLTAIPVLSACEREAGQLQAKQDIEELHLDLEGVQNSPSLQPSSNEAGPPIKVDPYPHSVGMSHRPVAARHDATKH